MADLFFVASARDFHAMDWYRAVKEVRGSRPIAFITDSISSEGYEVLIDASDTVIELYNIDWLLFSKQSKYGNLWRNLVKLMVFPLQARRLKAIARKHPEAVFHAHTMYYMFLCWAARLRFIGTPQGSEILVRPDRSRLYRYFAAKTLAAAHHLTVDSVNMQKKIHQLCRKEATVIQNGIDVATISEIGKKAHAQEHVVSIRGFTPLYRIDEILTGRQCSRRRPRLQFTYPFMEDVYRARVVQRLEPGDRDWGRVPRTQLYELYAAAKLAISIPISDSSPRSVYEAIFCGCCVAVTYNPWIEALPDCMKTRLFLVDLEDASWLERALEHADTVIQTPYVPSEAALDRFDQRRTMQRVADRFYRVA